MTDWQALQEYFADNSACNVYLLTDGEYYKLGIAEDIDQRIRQLQTGNAREIKLVTSFTDTRARCYAFEQRWHGWLKLWGLHVRLEWFTLPEEVLSMLVHVMNTGEFPDNSVVMPSEELLSEDELLSVEGLEEVKVDNSVVNRPDNSTRLEPRYTRQGKLRGFAVRERNKDRASRYIGKRSNPQEFQELKGMMNL